jgi:hypothetical protein
LSVSARSNQTAFEVNSSNADFDEVSFAFGANWYPVALPYAVAAPAVFLGMYFRTGWGNATAPTIDETANFTLISFPGIRGGLRYNFRNNLGLRIVASLETLELKQYEANRVDSAYEDQIKLVEGKMGFGIAYSF